VQEPNDQPFWTSSCKSSTCEEQEKEASTKKYHKKRVYSTTVGNETSLYRKEARPIVFGNEELHGGIPSGLSEDDTTAILDSMDSYCKRRCNKYDVNSQRQQCQHKGANNCCLRHQLGDDDWRCEAKEIIRECHQLLQNKVGEQLQLAKQELFRSTVEGVHEKSKRIDHNFTLPHNGKQIKVCRGVFAYAYGIKVDDIESMSNAYKNASYRGRVYNDKTKAWKDSTVFDYNWVETENVFSDNDINQGVIDDEMVTAAMAPSSNAELMCTIWLEKYFDLWDRSPDSDLTYVQCMDKLEVYKEYKAVMDRLPTGETNAVGQSRFYKLWKALYPHCVKRPHCDIPGKCATCYAIDKLRRSSEDKQVHLQLKKAHVMHRGGLFMLERKRYKERVFSALSSILKGEKNLLKLYACMSIYAFIYFINAHLCMCMYACLYIHTYIHIYMPPYVHTLIQICFYTTCLPKHT
jgi:hypothetical protein